MRANFAECRHGVSQDKHRAPEWSFPPGWWIAASVPFALIFWISLGLWLAGWL